MNRKFLSSLLAMTMMVSMTATAFAADATVPHTEGTDVVYEGTAAEAYTITVPSLLAPGESGDVTLSGTWASDRVVTVGADDSVELINSINPLNTKDLDVTFDGIVEEGSNEEAQTFTKQVSVANIENALFGTWSGEFSYYVEIADVATN